MRREIRLVARAAAIAQGGWLLAAFMTSSPTPRPWVLAAGVLALSVANPAAALLLVAALAPLGPLFPARAPGVALPLVDALVLAFLIGWLFERRDTRPGPRLPLAAAAAAALLVCDYLARTRTTTVAEAVAIVGGLGLTVATIDLFRRRPAVAVQLPIALAAGGAVSALAGSGHAASVSVMIACVATGMAMRVQGRWRLAWAIAGVAAFVRLSPPVRAAQNSYERIATEAGWLGAALFVAFLAAALWGIAQGVAASPRDARLLGCTAGVLAFVVGSIAADPLRLPYAAVPFWLLLGLTTALAGSSALHRQEASRGTRHRACA